MAERSPSHEAQQHGTRSYYVVFVALLALLAATVVINYLPLGASENGRRVRDALTAIGFAIAGLKAVLIILWFMHVKGAPRLTWVFSAAAFFFLAIMFALSFTDYGTREPVPGGRGESPERNPGGAGVEYRPEATTGHHAPPGGG